MARPIRETPVLMGEDAIRFEEEMKRVESLPRSTRRENRQNLERACRSFSDSLIVEI